MMQFSVSPCLVLPPILQEIANFSTAALHYIFPLPSLIPHHTTPPPLQVETPADVTPQWSSDLENLHPLNISHTNFAEKQRQDTWLGPLFQYLIVGENISVLANLPIKVSSWVRTTEPNCKIIDGILVYRDKLMENPDYYGYPQRT